MRAERIDYEFRLPDRDPGRPRGVHLSGVIRAALQACHMDPYGDTPDAASQLRMAVGLAWEDWYGPRIPNAIYHPGTLFSNRVYFSPDAIDLDNRILHEIKTTTSAVKPPTENLYWNLQLQGYLWCLGEGEWTRARMHVLHIGRQYQLAIWDVEYSPEELKQTWKNILEPYIDLAKGE